MCGISFPGELPRVVLTGDYGAPGKFGEITGLLENNGLAYSYILGNHDSGATRFFKEFIGGALFFFLDSSSGHYHAEHLVQDGQITQYVTPSALLQIEKLHDKIEIASCNFGYRIITVEEEIRSEVVWLKEINQEK